jgi:hypothetical protein
MNTFFGNFMTEISSITDPGQQSQVITYTQTTNFPSMPSTADDAQIWSLYFDESKKLRGGFLSFSFVYYFFCKLFFFSNGVTDGWNIWKNGQVFSKKDMKFQVA